jgi:endonuclease III
MPGEDSTGDGSMAKPSTGAIARAVLERHPRSPADELRIDVARNMPGPLYQWLIASLLFSARIAAAQAQSAAAALLKQGWRTPKKMAAVTWAERVKVLNRAGYARYDESTSRYIADTTNLLLERYGGDLRKLRDAAGRDPKRERQLLKQFKGIGDVGADIFFREAQLAWDELFPFADRRALDMARRFGLGSSAEELSQLVDRRELPRLLAGLVRVDLADEADDLLRAVA